MLTLVTVLSRFTRYAEFLLPFSHSRLQHIPNRWKFEYYFCLFALTNACFGRSCSSVAADSAAAAPALVAPPGMLPSLAAFTAAAVTRNRMFSVATRAAGGAPSSQL